jgi:hypothetical protein
VDLDTAAESQHARLQDGLQLEVGAGVGQEESRDRAATAVGGLPAWALRMAAEQAAFLPVVPPMKVGVVVRALLAGGCAHSGSDREDQTRVR